MSRILLNRVYYPVTVLGYGRRLGVWVQGCQRGCPGCISPKAQPFVGEPVEVSKLTARIPGDIRPDGLTISGGEPFEQTEAVTELAQWYKNTYNDDILIYTGYSRWELEQREDIWTRWLLENIAALADGPYVEGLNAGVGSIGSSNQRLHVFRYPERYQDFSVKARAMQCVQESGQLFWIGIPPGGKETEENGSFRADAAGRDTGQ